MRRDEWFDQLCRGTVAMLPSRHRSFLDEVPDLEAPGAPGDSVLLGQAALVAHICRGYRNALSANEVSEELIRGGLAPDQASVEEVMGRLVRPVFEALRLGRLPLDEWWSPERLHLLVFTWYVRWRLADTDEGSMRQELGERWSLSPNDVQMLIGEALLPAPVVPQLLREPASDERLAGFWMRKDVSQALRDEVARVPGALALHDGLFDMALAAARFRVLRDHRGVLGETFEDVEALLERIGEELEVNLTRFTGYELHRVRELDGDEQLLRASVDAQRNVHFVSSVGANAPADGYLDGLLVPEWLTEYVVSVGGRIGHRSCGPIPYWFAVLDVADLPDEILSGQAQTRIAVGEVQAESGLGEFVVQLHFRGEERVSEFYFADALDQAMQLALIALTGFVRLDFFYLREDGLLELIHSARYDVSDTPLRASARRGALHGLRGQDPDPGVLLNAWFQEHTADDGVGGFIGSDWAKAEELLGLGAPASEDGAESESIARYLAARERWLTASDELARARLVRTDVAPLEEAVADALADYRLARGDRDRRRSTEAEQERLETLVEGLVDAGTAFLHLNRSQDYLDGFLCVQGASGPIAKRLDLSVAPLRAIEDALGEWREAEPESLRRVMHSVGRGLGQAIADALSEHRVGHVFVSPIGFLSELPLCVLELEDGSFLGDLVSISYAPSARVLQRLRAQGSTGASGVLAVAYHEEDDIPMTNGEVAILDALHTDVVTLRGSGATPRALLGASGGSRLLHLACHGTWRLGDAYGSGLHLAGDTLAEGYLSVAQLYRDADLSGVELVVLSACDTGRALTLWPQIENYTGIDGAFLACGARSVISSLWEVDDLAGLLFSVALHQALAENASLVQAFARGVQMLRSGRYLEMDGSPEARLLDAVALGWREDVEEVGDELKDPYYWAVFKLSGLLGPPVSRAAASEGDRDPAGE
jgi:CHAT domain-containing protein